ncbi:hypothetical protein ACR6C2_30475 [Streptomyces sp. INA 01156]
MQEAGLLATAVPLWFGTARLARLTGGAPAATDLTAVRRPAD